MIVMILDDNYRIYGGRFSWKVVQLSQSLGDVGIYLYTATDLLYESGDLLLQEPVF